MTSTDTSWTGELKSITLLDARRLMDQISPVWHVFDLLPSGRGDFCPDNRYPLAP